jgi:nucleotide sugar dehydrogenase
MKALVIGLGKIGLPLAVQYASKGVATIGLDINEETVELVNSGLEPFPEEYLLQERLREVVSNKMLTATSNTELAISSVSVIVVAVPLFVDAEGMADFRIIDDVTAKIAKFMRPGTLVCFETTLPVGTTRNRFTKSLEKLSGMEPGKDFFVVFSPERVLTGRVFADLRKYPKILGGITEECRVRGKAFYSKVLDFDIRADLDKPNGVWDLGSTESAEFVKLAETTYRDVNIGLANQFAKFADKIEVDIQSIIEAANSQSFSHIHQPGISVGGHCIPIYPQFYLQNDPSASIVRSAREANQSMPEFFVNMILDVDTETKGKKVLVLGVTYRPNVKEVAFSGAFSVKRRLESLGMAAYFDDPLLSNSDLIELGLEPAINRTDYDFAVIHTAHAQYENFDFSVFPKLQQVIDGRGIMGQGLGLVNPKL